MNDYDQLAFHIHELIRLDGLFISIETLQFPDFACRRYSSDPDMQFQVLSGIRDDLGRDFRVTQVLSAHNCCWFRLHDSRTDELGLLTVMGVPEGYFLYTTTYDSWQLDLANPTELDRLRELCKRESQARIATSGLLYGTKSNRLETLRGLLQRYDHLPWMDSNVFK